MPSYNKILLMGHLTRDVALKHLPNNTAIAEFGLAVNRKFKRADGSPGEEVLFVDCTAFGRTGEVINQYFHKGDAIFVEGRLKLDTWQDKQTGDKRSKHTVAVDSFQFVGNKGDGESTRGGGQRGERQPVGAGAREQTPRDVLMSMPGDIDVDSGDIPF